jgi:hypothetical protein
MTYVCFNDSQVHVVQSACGIAPSQLRDANSEFIAASAEKFVRGQCVVGILEYSSCISSDEKQLAALLDSNNSYPDGPIALGG